MTVLALARRAIARHPTLSPFERSRLLELDDQALLALAGNGGTVLTDDPATPPASLLQMTAFLMVFGATPTTGNAPFEVQHQEGRFPPRGGGKDAQGDHGGYLGSPEVY
jgi:hypothetical protein